MNMKTKNVKLGPGYEYLGHFGGKQCIREGHNVSPWPDDLMPQRNMQKNSDPKRKQETGIPNVYRGKLQPDLESGNSLPENFNPNKKIRI